MADPSYVGHGFMSPESSSDTQYLYRSAPVRDADAKKNKKLARTNNEALTVNFIISCCLVTLPCIELSSSSTEDGTSR